MVPHDFPELYNFPVAQEMGLTFRVRNRSRFSLSDSYTVTKFEGIFFYEILFWGNSRNKSVHCTFSLWLCQAYGTDDFSSGYLTEKYLRIVNSRRKA